MGEDNDRTIPVLYDKTIYETWKKMVKIWQKGTNAKAGQQAPKLVMAMKGKARQVAIQLDVDELGAENGVNTLVAEMDTL